MIMFNEITYYVILGRPLIFYGGLLTLTLLVSTFLIPFLMRRNKKIPFTLHPVLAKITIVLAMIHGLMAILAYL